MSQQTKYLFHPQLEIFRCGGGVLMCHILGNKISVFEKSIDDKFSAFILYGLKSKKAFSVQDMENYFSKAGQKYNFGPIIQKLEKAGLIKAQDNNKDKSLVFINLTDIQNERILNISEEVGLKSFVELINGLDGDLYKSLEKIGEKMVFVLSDFQAKYKVSELNLYFFKKGVFWCPVFIDSFGGYIGPLIESVPSGPCFSCYEEKIYNNPEGDKFKNISALQNIFLRVMLLEALKVGTNISPSQIIYSHLIEIDCWNHRSRKHYIYPDSDCPVCGI